MVSRLYHPTLSHPYDIFQDGDRAIHLAVQNGDQEIVNLLVDYQADIDSPNYRRVTPLAVACKLQDWQMVNHLLDKQVRYHIL